MSKGWHKTRLTDSGFRGHLFVGMIMAHSLLSVAIRMITFHIDRRATGSIPVLEFVQEHDLVHRLTRSVITEMSSSVKLLLRAKCFGFPYYHVVSRSPAHARYDKGRSSWTDDNPSVNGGGPYDSSFHRK